MGGWREERLKIEPQRTQRTRRKKFFCPSSCSLWFNLLLFAFPHEPSRRIRLERDRAFRSGRIEQLLHAKLRLLERILAVAVERDAALERLQRIVERELALL